MDTSTQVRLLEAEDLINKGHKREAFSLLAQLLAKNAQLAPAWYLLSQCVDDEDKKKYALQRALALDPAYVEARQGQFSLINRTPRQPSARSQLILDHVIELLKHRLKGDAREELQAYLSEFPDDEEGWFLFGIALEEPEAKREAFSKALELNPSHQKSAQQLIGLESILDAPASRKASDLPLRERFKTSTFYRLGKFILRRAAIILVTIVLGVFVAVLIANKGGQIDDSVRNEVETRARQQMGMIDTPEQQVRLERELCSARHKAGLLLPGLPRNLLWTFRALSLDWGDVMYINVTSLYWSRSELTSVREIILDRLPNSLMLVGFADLFIFLGGIPLALALSRQKSSRLDKLFSFLAPISSIPSWILGLVLIMIFAVELQVLPPSGMFDILPPETKWGYIFVVGKHMILPVLAIILSLVFQLIYTWRTFFLIYANEDYVELAKAKGLDSRALEKKYILRPSAPFIITTFSLTLVSFWQMTTALEVVFAWPGIGKLYVDSLPHFWGEGVFPGEMLVAVALVVLFAYLLGFIVLLLDLLYALLDPRVKFDNPAVATLVAKKTKTQAAENKDFGQLLQEHLQKFSIPKRQKTHLPIKLRLRNILRGFNRQATQLIGLIKEVRQYPSALIGLFIIIALIIGSIYAVVALPYAEIGTRWYVEGVTGEINVPKLAQPAWFNYFRSNKLLSSIIIKEGVSGFVKDSEVTGENSSKVTITFSFEYPYSALPEDLFINFTPHYQEKRPFVVLTWITPDGREIELKNFSVEASGRVPLADYMPRDLKVEERAAIQWGSQNYGNLFISPLFLPSEETSDSQPLKGIYTLRVEGFMFEDGGDLEAELVVLGQVYGFAGTDYLRRDLLVPLLWGMPFALLFGLLGATATTVLSMILAATGVWFGGWVDNLIRSINEATMILPILAFAVLFYAMFNIDIWMILAILVLMNVFGTPTKAFRAAFLQVKESPFIEAAKAYGASNRRIIMAYMIPRIIPVLIPQLVALIPSFVFLEATLGMFNITSMYPTWGKVIYDALRYGLTWGSRYWVLEPIGLLLLTGFAFAMVGFALDQILNPRLKAV